MKADAISKFLSRITLLGAIVLISACSNNEIGFIDTIKILQESDHGKTAVNRMDTFQNSAVKQLEAMEAERVKAEKAKDTEKMNRINMEMQAYAYELQNKLQAEQELVFNKVSEELNKTVDAYRKEHKLSVVLNASDAISYDESADVTQEIMDAFNALTLEFGDLPNIAPSAPK